MKSPRPRYTMVRRWTDAEGGEALRELVRSGLSVRAFAAREGLDEHRIHRWRQRLGSDLDRAQSPAVSFVEVPRPGTALVEVVLRSGRVLRVAEAIESGTLRRFLDVLEHDAC